MERKMDQAEFDKFPVEEQQTGRDEGPSPRRALDLGEPLRVAQFQVANLAT
jgi:hypothetical protein